jgi:hypothetical protein
MKLRVPSPLRNHRFPAIALDDPFPTIRSFDSHNYSRKCSHLMTAIRPYHLFHGVSHAFLGASFFMVRTPSELTEELREQILDELRDLPLLSADVELRSLAKTKELKQPVGVILDGSDPQVITYLLLGTYRTAILLDIGRLKEGNKICLPPFIQKLFSRKDLRIVGSGILHDLANFVRIGLNVDPDTLIDTQDIVDVRAPEDTRGKTGMGKQSMCVFKSHAKISRAGFSEGAQRHQEKEIEDFERHAADWCRSNHVLERYTCYNQYSKAWHLTHRLYDWDADEEGNILWRAKNYLFFDAVVPVLYCLRVVLGIRSHHPDYHWRTKREMSNILMDFKAQVRAANRYYKPPYRPAEEIGFPTARMPRTLPHSPVHSSSSDDLPECDEEEIIIRRPVAPKEKYKPEVIMNKPTPASLQEADMLPPILPNSNKLPPGEYCFYRAKLDYLEANHYPVLYDYSKPWQGRTALEDDLQPVAPSVNASAGSPWDGFPKLFGVCRRCGEEGHNAKECVTQIVQCPYPLCLNEEEHAFPACRDFMRECPLCRFKGHREEQCDMRVIGERVKLWEEVAGVHVLAQFHRAHIRYYCYPAKDELIHLTSEDLRQHEPYSWVMIFERLALGSAIQSGQPPWPNSDPPKNHQELLRSRKVKFQEYKTNFPITGGGLLSRHVIDNGCPVFGPFNRPKFEMSPVHQDCLVLFRKYCEALSLWAQHNPLEYRRRAYALMTPMEAEKQANEDFDMLHSEGIFPRTSSRTRSESQRPGTSAGGMRFS